MRRGRVDSLDALAAEIVGCRACPRLVEWREQVAAEKRAAFADETYWGRPVPGFGDPAARIVGRRAGAGGPRGQPHRAGCSPATAAATGCSGRCTAPGWPTSRRRCAPATGCACTAPGSRPPVHCAPPDNKPTPAERDACAPFLDRELELLRPRVVVCLGAFGYARGLPALRRASPPAVRPRRRGRSCRAVRRCCARSTPASRTRSPAG